MNQNIICITKVSELEWYLSMKSYHSMKENSVSTKENQKSMTLQKFHEFYESLAFPMIYESEGKIGFLCPFNDTISIPPKGSVEIPLGYSISGDFNWIQPENSSILTSSKKIGGTAGACGTVIIFTNISNEVKVLTLKKNAPLGMISYEQGKVRIMENKSESFLELYKALDRVFPGNRSSEEIKNPEAYAAKTDLPSGHVGYVIGIHIPTLNRILEELNKSI